MPTVEKITGGEVRIRGVGRFTRGDQADVDENMAQYLSEERGDFKIVDEDGVTDVDFEEIDDDADTDDVPDEDEPLEELTKEEVMDLAREADVEGRSSMTKDKLIDALSEDSVGDECEDED